MTGTFHWSYNTDSTVGDSTAIRIIADASRRPKKVGLSSSLSSFVSNGMDAVVADRKDRFVAVVLVVPVPIVPVAL
jgi:hypothetical protein